MFVYVDSSCPELFKYRKEIERERERSPRVYLFTLKCPSCPKVESITPTAPEVVTTFIPKLEKERWEEA
jgi:hypothetical protein